MKRRKKFLIWTAPLLFGFLAYVFGMLYKRFIKPYVFPCIFRMFTGYYCCGCGGTRSFYALLDGNLILSLKYNPIVLFTVISLLLIWLELVFKTFNRQIKLLPRSSFFWHIVILIFIFFYIARNIF